MTNFFKYLTYFTLAGLLSVVIGLCGTFLYLAPNLPEVDSLLDIQLQVPLRIYTSDAELIGEFGDKRRTPVEIEHVPETFKNAFLAAEDDLFYEHNGISYKGLGRAIFQMLTGAAQQTGGSTITQQVAKNYFLTPERKITRKLREIFLSLQIEAELSKDQILQLYVNKIFLGHRSYGISAAAQVYYGKKITELSIAEMAMISGLPKAPSAFNPISNPDRALIRRNWILGRMLGLGYINQAEYDKAHAAPITAQRHNIATEVDAPYVAEMVRQEALEKFGEAIYSDGYVIYTTINGKMQNAAQKALQNGILAYDARHGFRGGEYRLKDLDEETKNTFFENNRTIVGMIPAIVTEVSDTEISFELKGGELVTITKSELEELKIYETEDIRHKWKKLTDIIKPARAVRLKPLEDGKYQLTQLPNIQGALVSLNANNGGILAITGGFEYYQSKFNRAAQAKRQIGSNVKPFVYAAALNKGYTPATLINDAPVVFNDSQLESTWRPDNADKQFLGPIRLREALYRSRNLVSVRILQQVGLVPIINYMSNFGLDKKALPRDLSLSLGSPNFTPLEVATAYAAFANQGYKITPYIIDEIRDFDNQLVFKASPSIACDDCLEEKEDEIDDSILIEDSKSAETIEEKDVGNASNEADTLTADSGETEDESNQEPDNDYTPEPPSYAPRIIDEKVAFIIDDILKDVIRRGTGYRARSLNRSDIAGKTGTTNGPTDAWFSGYNPNIVTSAWVGFDDNRNLGRGEYGGSAALPIWIEFMKTALDGQAIIERQPPQGITNVLISKETGKQPSADDENTMFEYIRLENLPTINNADMNDDSGESVDLDDLF